MQHVIRQSEITNLGPTARVIPGRLDSGITERFDRLFKHSDGTDMREIPMVKHPYTGNWHYNHGFWPLG